MRRPLLQLACAIVLGLGLGGCASGSTTVIVGPSFDDEQTEVLEEAVELRCVGDGPRQRCVLDAEVLVRTASPRPTVAVVTRGVERVDLHDPAAKVELIAHEATEPALPSTLPNSRASRAGRAPLPWTSARFELDAEPGEVHELQLHVVFRPEAVTRTRFAHSPALARHRQLSEWFSLETCHYDPRGCKFWLTYLPARGARKHELRVEDIEADIDDDLNAPVPKRRLTLYSGRRPFAPGGPFVGFGLVFAKPELPKVRAGWELFAPTYLAHALALEFDGLRRTTVALTSELMSPMLIIAPSVGIGAGLPIQISPELLVGARGQLSLQLPYVGLLTTLDVFPSADEDRLRPSLFVQFVL